MNHWASLTHFFLSTTAQYFFFWAGARGLVSNFFFLLCNMGTSFFFTMKSAKKDIITNKSFFFHEIKVMPPAQRHNGSGQGRGRARRLRELHRVKCDGLLLVSNGALWFVRARQGCVSVTERARRSERAPFHVSNRCAGTGMGRLEFTASASASAFLPPSSPSPRLLKKMVIMITAWSRENGQDGG